MSVELYNLTPAEGSIKAKKRVGRGQGTGKGRTCTRGHKGAQSRSGYKRRDHLQGGETTFSRGLPKFPNGNPRKKVIKIFNLVELQRMALADKVKAINPAYLVLKGRLKSGEPYKVLGKGDLTSALEVSAHHFSAEAERAIVEKKGRVVRLKSGQEAMAATEVTQGLAEKAPEKNVKVVEQPVAAKEVAPEKEKKATKSSKVAKKVGDDVKEKAPKETK